MEPYPPPPAPVGESDRKALIARLDVVLGDFSEADDYYDLGPAVYGQGVWLRGCIARSVRLIREMA